MSLIEVCFMKGFIRIAMIALGISCFYLVQVFHADQYSHYETYSVSKNYSNSYRIGRLLWQIEHIKSGHYIRRHLTDGNVLFDNKAVADDTGTYLLLSDWAYLKRHLSPANFSFSMSDAFFLQFFLISVAIIVLFLPVIPLPVSLLSFLALLIANWSNYIEWDLFLHWQPSVSVVLLTALLLSLVEITRRLKIKAVELVQVIAIAFYIGVLGLCRNDSKIVAVLSLLTFSVLNLSALIVFMVHPKTHVHIVQLVRESNSAWGKLKVLWKSLLFRRFALCAALFLSVIVLPNAAYYLNLVFFEKTEGIELTSKWNKGGHVFWQPFYMGLGATGLSGLKQTVWNHENVQWNEDSVAYEAWTTDPYNKEFLPRIIPGAQYSVFALSEVFKTFYLEVASNNLLDVFKTYFVKVKGFIQYFLSMIVVCVLVFLFSLYRSFSSPASFLSMSLIQGTFFTMFCLLAAPAVFMSASSDGQIMSPDWKPYAIYINSFRTLLISYPLVLPGVLFSSMHRRSLDLYWKDRRAFILAPKIMLVTMVCFLLLFLLGVSFSVRGDLLKSKRLRESISASPVNVEDLFLNNYHADIVRSVNGLPEEKKSALLESLTKSKLGASITLSPANKVAMPKILIEDAKWVSDRLFLFIRTTKELYDCEIPLKIHDPKMPTNGKILLPTYLKPGRWLFSARVGAKSNDVTVFDADRQLLNIQPIATITNMDNISCILTRVKGFNRLQDLYLEQTRAGGDNKILKQAFKLRETELLAQPNPFRSVLTSEVELVDFKWERLTPKQSDGMAQFEGSFLLRITEQPTSLLNKDISLSLWFLADAKYKDLFQKSGVSFPGFGFSLAKLPVQSWKKGDYYLAKRPYRVLDVPYQLKMGLGADGKLLSPWVELGQYPPTPAP
jgi:hypothetical protein